MFNKAQTRGGGAYDQNLVQPSLLQHAGSKYEVNCFATSNEHIYFIFSLIKLNNNTLRKMKAET